MLILQILSLGPAHGYAIAQRLEQISRAVVQVNQGSLYPALHRLEQKRWLKAEWKPSETGREAKVLLVDALPGGSSSRSRRQLGAAFGRGPVDLQRGGADMKRMLNWFRRDALESDLDRELRYHVDRRVATDAVRAGRVGSATAGDAGARRLGAGAGGSARRLADPVAAGLRLRPAILRPQVSAQSARSPRPPCFRSRSVSARPRRSIRWSIR